MVSPLLRCTLLAVVLLSVASAQPGEQRVLIWSQKPASIQERHRLRLRSARQIGSLPLVAAAIRDRDLATLRTDPDIDFVAEDRKYYTDLLPAIPVAGIPSVWESGYMGALESVAAVDTGIKVSHPMFTGINIVSRVFLKTGAADPCFADDAASTEDVQGHGTRTASILAGQALPEFPGYYGAARGVGTLYALKAGFRARPNDPACPARDGVLYGSDIFDALVFAATETPVRIVNLSIGAPADRDDDILAKVSDFFVETYGMTLVFSAGNSGTDANLNTPGIAYNGISVANLDDRGTETKSDDVIHPTSTRGPTPGLRNKPDLAAPGTGVYAADIASNGLNVATGTSAATPIVTGTAVLLREAGVQDALALKALLLNSTDPNSGGGWRRDSGWGLINATTAFDQRWNVATGVIRASASRFFRGTFAGPSRTTLVWNRHVDTSAALAPSRLNTLGLRLYRASDGAQLSRIDGFRDNVLSLDIPSAGDYVLQVIALDPVFSLELIDEPFALALSRAGIGAAGAPALNLRCAHANPIAVNTDVTVTCVATNAGTLPLFDITGTLPAPAGFSSGGSQSFGNLTAGGSRTLSWTFRTPVSPGAFDLTATATATSYGISVQTTASTTQLEVVSANPLLSLEPAILYLTPETPTASIRVSGSGVARSANVNAPWLQASTSGSAVSVSLNATAAGLAPGSYSATVVIGDGGAGSARSLVRLTVPEAKPRTVSIESSRITVDAIVRSGCPAPEALSAISESAKMQFWFLAHAVTPSDHLMVQWHSPVGLADVVNIPPVASSGSYCFAVTGVDVTSRYGAWRADLLLNGARVATAAVTVQSAVRMTSPGSCVSEVRKLRVCPEISGAVGRSVRFEFTRPDGVVDGSLDVTWPPTAGIEYEPSVPARGEWTIHVFSGGVSLGTLPVNTESQPIEVEIDFPAVHFATPGSGKVEWVGPDGAESVIPFEGGMVSIELPESSVPGTWKIRIITDGVMVFSKSVQRHVTIELNKSSFSPLDRSADFTFCVDTDKSSRKAIDYQFLLHDEVKLTGGFVRTGDFAVGSTDPWCVQSGLMIAGFAAQAGSGTWTIRVSFNGIEAASEQFTVRSNAKPERVSFSKQ